MDDINPVMKSAIESVTAAMAGAFDEVWSRPNAATTMEGFLAGHVRFVIDRDGVTVLVEKDEPAPPPTDPCPPDPGHYL